MTTINKTKLAEKLNLICPSGQYNGRKLKRFCCHVLKIKEDEYKQYRIFTKKETEKLLAAVATKSC